MKPADVAYVHPAKQPVGFRYDLARANYIPYLLMPVGSIGLANLLRQHGYGVRGVNYAIEAFLEPLFDLKSWLRQVGRASLVMIDLHWYEHAYGALDVAAACKQAWPQTRIVLGGFTASYYAHEILEHSPDVDFVIRGDAEEPLLALAGHTCARGGRQPHLEDIPNLSYRAGDRILENGQSYCVDQDGLDRLDFVTTEFLDHHQQYAEMQYTGLAVGVDRADTSRLLATTGHWLCTGRGCLFDCSYCGGGKAAHRQIAGRQRLTLRSVDRVVDDIRRLAEAGRDQVSLGLDPAVLGKTFWSRLFAGLREQGVRIGIYNEHFQLPTPDFIEDYVQSAHLPHSVLAFSPLSGSAKVRRMNGKLFSNEQLIRTLNILRRHEVPVYIYFSFNLPGEDEKSFQRTLSLADRIFRMYPSHLLRIYSMCHTVDPASPMSVDPHKYGIQLGMRSFADYFEYCRQTYVARPEHAGGVLRGFSADGRRGEVVESMVRAWNRLCVGREEVCRPALSV